MMNACKAWAIAHKPATIGVCVAVAVVIAAGIAYATSQSNANETTNGAPAQAQMQETSDAAVAVADDGSTSTNDPVTVAINPQADDAWTDDSSPVIIHVQSIDAAGALQGASNDAPTSASSASDGSASSEATGSQSTSSEAVDFYHATSHNVTNDTNDTIDLAPGTYTVTVISPVNADGSIEVYANDNDGNAVTKSFDVTIEPDMADATVAEEPTTTASATSTGESADAQTGEPQTDEPQANEPQTDKPQTIEIPMVNVPADQVTDDQAKQIADETAKAVEKGDDTLKGNNGTSVLDKVNENIKANPNVSDGTKDSVQSTSEQAKTETKTEPTPTAPAQPTTQPSTPSKDNTSGSTASSSSTGSSGQSSQTTTPKSTRHWVDEQGHWENTTEQVWVPNVVTVTDTPATTKQVYDHTVFTFSYDGYTTTDKNDCLAHAKALLKAGNPSFYSDQDVYTTQTVPAVTHTEDHGHYETKVTGKKWVVDVAGHWED